MAALPRGCGFESGSALVSAASDRKGAIERDASALVSSDSLAGRAGFASHSRRGSALFASDSCHS